MVSSDGCSVSVTSEHNDRQFRISELDSCGEGDSSAVSSVQSVEIKVARRSRRASYA